MFIETGNKVNVIVICEWCFCNNCKYKFVNDGDRSAGSSAVAERVYVLYFTLTFRDVYQTWLPISCNIYTKTHEDVLWQKKIVTKMGYVIVIGECPSKLFKI